MAVLDPLAAGLPAETDLNPPRLIQREPEQPASDRSAKRPAPGPVAAPDYLHWRQLEELPKSRPPLWNSSPECWYCQQAADY